MTEKLLQFIWQFGYFNHSHLLTTEREEIVIIFPGAANANGGPDFSVAEIQIGNTTFFGNVELHLRTSDWERHAHISDPQYGNVILHVVFQHDKKLSHAIPVLELESRISNLLLHRYEELMSAGQAIPCGANVSSVKPLIWMSWKERLLSERLARKAKTVLANLEEANHHWEEVLWWTVARHFGRKVNGDAFESVAKSLPLSTIAKHRSSIHQLEALLLGQAGLLQSDFADEYPKMLKREYQFLQKKWNLQPSLVPVQFLRMRPMSFPSIKLAQLAALLQTSSHLFSKMLDAKSVQDLRPLFTITANDYWHYHYTLDHPTSFKMKKLGTDAIDSLFINAFAPMLFAYGIYQGEEAYKSKALHWLEELDAEQNVITKLFTELGVEAKTAFDSQSLIELKNEYCSPKKCLNCSVGNFLLKADTLAFEIKSTS